MSWSAPPASAASLAFLPRPRPCPRLRTAFLGTGPFSAGPSPLGERLRGAIALPATRKSSAVARTE
eukprot:7668144-Pyramimonas_sp.AAC.1